MVVLLVTASSLAAQDPVKPLPVPPSQELPTGIRWKTPLSAPPGYPPVIAGDRVFVSALPSLVVAYDLADGHELWRQPLHPERPVVADGNRLYVASADAVQAVNSADGSVVWRTPTGAVTAPLLVKDGWIIAASGLKLMALRAADGEVIWSRDSGPQQQRPAISGDLLFVPLASGWIRAHDLISGAPRWERQLEGAPAEPLVVADRVYAGATDKKFYCLDAVDGEIEWAFRVGAEIRGTAIFEGDRIYYVGLDNLLRAHSRLTGSERWHQGLPFRPFEAPRVFGPALVVSGPTNDVLLLNLRDGRPSGKVSFPESLALAPAFATSNDALVVAGITGGLTEAWTLWLATPQPTAPR